MEKERMRTKHKSIVPNKHKKIRENKRFAKIFDF